jgi:hypothetical protein
MEILPDRWGLGSADAIIFSGALVHGEPGGLQFANPPGLFPRSELLDTMLSGDYSRYPAGGGRDAIWIFPDVSRS